MLGVGVCVCNASKSSGTECLFTSRATLLTRVGPEDCCPRPFGY